jgi:plasmid stabilization system protein ParE
MKDWEAIASETRDWLVPDAPGVASRIVERLRKLAATPGLGGDRPDRPSGAGATAYRKASMRTTRTHIRLSATRRVGGSRRYERSVMTL